MGFLGRKPRGLRGQLDTGRKIVALGADAKQMWAEQQQAQAAMHQDYETKVHDWTGPDFEPIASISVQQYAQICKAIEATPGGASNMDAIAEQHGVAAGTWQQVSDGWIARCAKNPAVATALNESYRGVA